MLSFLSRYSLYTRLYLNVKHFKTSFVKCRLEELYLVDILKSDTLNISGGHNSVSAFSQPTAPGLESMPVRGGVWAGAGERRGGIYRVFQNVL